MPDAPYGDGIDRTEYGYRWKMCEFRSPSGRLCSKPHLHAGKCECRVGALSYIWDDKTEGVVSWDRSEIDKGCEYYVSENYLNDRNISTEGLRKIDLNFLSFGFKCENAKLIG